MFTLRKRRYLLSFSAVVVVASLVPGIAAGSSVTDPRRCSAVTPGGVEKHAYWCARDAAVAAVRASMARRQGVARWFAPTFCDQASTLLRWRCSTNLGGDRWLVSVTWKATSTGWHRYVSTVQQP